MSKETEMDKAIRILNDSNVTALSIADNTGISRISVSNYRTGKTDIKKAKWEIIHKLAEYYDDLKFNDMIGLNNFQDYTSFSNMLIGFFSGVKQSQNKEWQAVIDEISNVVNSDPKLVARLFKIQEDVKAESSKLTYLQFNQRINEQLNMTTLIAHTQQASRDEQHDRVWVFNGANSTAIAKIYTDKVGHFDIDEDYRDNQTLARLVKIFANTPIQERKYDEVGKPVGKYSRLIRD